LSHDRLQDIVMARSNGAAVSANLKLRGLRIPIYCMSANTSAADMARYTAAGMESFAVAKPFSLGTLKTVLRQVKAQREVDRSLSPGSRGSFR
jgi:CheY-like chemotaxis protein